MSTTTTTTAGHMQPPNGDSTFDALDAGETETSKERDKEKYCIC